MSNDLFKPHKTGSGQKQDPPQEPAAPGMSGELLEKIVSLLKGIETMNGKIADNYDIIDEMRSSLRKLRDQLQNIEVPEARLDEESRNFLLSAPDSITAEVEKRLSEKLEKFSVRLDDVLKDAESSVKKAADGGTSKVTNAVNSAKGEISGFKEWCERWLWYFIGAIIWAILASGMAVWQCSSAISARSDVEYELDSLRLNSDVYHDFINHSEVTGRAFDSWLQLNMNDYKSRIHHRDSLRKEK
jgi:hypothetical protein